MLSRFCLFRILFFFAGNFEGKDFAAGNRLNTGFDPRLKIYLKVCAGKAN